MVLTLLTAAGTLTVVGAACGGEGANSAQRIVAAFYPLQLAAERVAPTADVENLTPAGAEPHDLELSPRDVDRIRSADLVLYLGRGFMPQLEKALEGQTNAVDLLAGEKLLRESDGGSRLDPHVWLDPKRLARIAIRVADVIGQPGAADGFVSDLEALDGEFRDSLETCERNEIVTSHSAFAYLAAAYRLRQIALTGIAPEAEPGPRELERLIDEVREARATTVFFETLVSPKLAETVAREAGAATAVLNPLEGLTEDQIDAGADYFSVMRENLAALRKALGCR
jgi:zinc transport system substrate-binding protein